MMNNFPIPYNDENFYSIVSRYKRMNALSDKNSLFEDFCNRIERQSFMLLPIHIGELIKNLPYTSKITERYMIYKHTIFPYLTAFIPDERAEKVFGEMIEGRRKSPIVRVGMNSSPVKFSRHMKLCPECIQSDIEATGEAFWRRLHQIPGVYFCKTHGCILKESKVIMNDNQKEFICADEIDLNKENPDVSDSQISKFHNTNIKYIEAVEYLLNNELERNPYDFFTDFYIDKLRHYKLASRSGVINIKELLREFKSYYSEDYLNIMQSNYEEDDEHNWLRLFVRKNDKSKNVLRHLLLLQFLDTSVEELFNTDNVQGKYTILTVNEPRLDIEKRKEEWLKIIIDNPGATRRELKDIGKGVYTYIYKYEKEWYHKVTPLYKRKSKAENVIDWESRDNECLSKAKEAVRSLLSKPGKPVRITKAGIRRECKMPTYFKSEKLKKTNEYIISAIETTETYRRRKIEWAIKEMKEKGINLTVYKIHQYAGFGEVKHKSIKIMIEDMIKD